MGLLVWPEPGGRLLSVSPRTGPHLQALGPRRPLPAGLPLCCVVCNADPRDKDTPAWGLAQVTLEAVTWLVTFEAAPSSAAQPLPVAASYLSKHEVAPQPPSRPLFHQPPFCAVRDT